MHRRKMYLNIQKYTWPVKAIDSYFVSRDVGIVKSIIYIVKTILIYFTYLNINKYRSVLLKIFNQPATNMQSFPLNSSKIVSAVSLMFINPRRISATSNITSRLAIKIPTPYEWWSNALPPGQEKTSNARGMPGGDVEASIWLLHNQFAEKKG